MTAGTTLTVCKMMKAKIKEEGKKRYFSFGGKEIEGCISTLAKFVKLLERTFCLCST